MIILLGSRDWICCLFRVGLAWYNFCVEVSLPGSPVCWAFAVFLLERHGGKFFVELEPLMVLFHVGLDFLFCFTSDLRGFLLEWCFRGLTLDFHFIFLASTRRQWH
jgi:hypothetical protein